MWTVKASVLYRSVTEQVTSTFDIPTTETDTIKIGNIRNPDFPNFSSYRRNSIVVNHIAITLIRLMELVLQVLPLYLLVVVESKL